MDAPNHGSRLPSERPSSLSGRVRVLRIVFCAVVGFYLCYLFGLQVLNGSIYERRAAAVASRVITIPAQRGEIFDRFYNQPLATNVPAFAVEVVPAAAASNLKRDISRLSNILKVPEPQLWNRIPAGWANDWQAVQLKTGVPLKTISSIAERLNEFPGVTWQNKPRRYYPVAGSISHVVGYVGPITSRELQVLYNKGYNANSIVGQDGVEEQYDRILRGKNGQEIVQVDASGRRVKGAPTIVRPPTDGDNLVLTINRHIQRLAERALGPRMGSVVVLKPSTGAVLALVSYPWYNPNLFEQPSSGAALNKTFLNPNFPFLDRPVQDAAAPASTFKIIMTTADYATNAFPPNEYIDTTGSMVYGGRVWHDWQPNGFGPINLPEAFAESSDQYFWTLGAQYLGIDRILKFARMFGLGKPTGIDLPGENPGLLPTPQWKSATLGKPWVGGDTMDMSIGQGYLQTTPLQMADVVAMVANRGTVYRPHVLREIRNPNTGQIIKRVKPQVLLHPPISRHVFNEVASAMRGEVVFGTASVVITEKAVKIAGKTGTGQVGIKNHYTSWFVSFGPYQPKNPADQVVVVVMEDASNTWDWWGPKAASIIYQGIFAHEDFQQAVKALEPVWYLNSKDVGNFDF